jgi:DNA-binding response OmpR family regulator
MDKNKNGLDVKKQVLIIEHDPALRKVMLISLEQAGMKVKAVSRYANALEFLQQESPDIFIMDLDMRGGDLEKLISVYRKHLDSDQSTVMVLTANRLKDDWRRKHQPDAVIYKPFDIRYLIRKIDNLTKNKSIPAQKYKNFVMNFTSKSQQNG